MSSKQRKYHKRTSNCRYDIVVRDSSRRRYVIHRDKRYVSIGTEEVKKQKILNPTQEAFFHVQDIMYGMGLELTSIVHVLDYSGVKCSAVPVYKMTWWQAARWKKTLAKIRAIIENA